MPPRYLIDACVLIGAVNSADATHGGCYNFFKNNEDAILVVPTLAYFEFQATQSRIKNEGKRAIRELYIPNLEKYEITDALIRRANELDLFNKFKLKGADLIYACIAAIEAIPLVTTDRDFESIQSDVKVVWIKQPPEDPWSDKYPKEQIRLR